MKWVWLLVVQIIVRVRCEEEKILFDLTDKIVDNFGRSMDELKILSFFYEPRYHNLKVRNAVNESHHYEPKDGGEFDFIIVGGGTSGAVLANRLSQVPEWKVLLLEAGESENVLSRTPAIHNYLENTPLSWMHTTTPQNTSCLGMKDYKCALNHGRALGGTTAINDMLYVRGNPKDYELWADQGPNIGWCWDSVFPRYKSLESAHLNNFDRKYHHMGGEVHIENPECRTKHLSKHIFNAAEELGLKSDIDYNGKVQVGFGIPQVMTKSGKRQSTAEGFLEPAKMRKNLVIRPLSHVTKVLISDHTKEAYGVEYVHDEELFVSKAKKEVVLAGGAINTAQLLKLSGIGPKEELHKMGIDCVKDLKVGHLKDQLVFPGINLIHDEPKYFYDSYLDKDDHHKNDEHDSYHRKDNKDYHKKDHEDDYVNEYKYSKKNEHRQDRHHEDHSNKKVHYDRDYYPKDYGYDYEKGRQNIEQDEHMYAEEEKCSNSKNYILESYLKNGKGPLAAPGAEVIGFLKRDKPYITRPEIELQFVPELFNKGCDTLRNHRYTEEVYDEYWKPLEGKEGFSILVTLLHPKSSGYVELASKDPMHPPLVHYNQLSDKDDEDLEQMVEGIRFAKKMAKCDTMKKLKVHLSDRHLPDCYKKYGHDEDDYWKCAVRHLAFSSKRFSGTARMGPEKDPEAVVDEHLNVHGVHKLRVADSSVIPVTISGDLAAATIMIGHTAGELIQKDWLE